MSEVYESIMQGLREALAHAQGKPVEGTREHRMSIRAVPDFSPSEIRQIRLDANMTQAVFAACLGVTGKAIEGWEGGRSHPNGAVRRMLGLMRDNPHFADDVGIIVR